MNEREAILAAIAPREEIVQFGGVQVCVRELASAADLMDAMSGEDAAFQMLVRSVTRADGTAVFSAADIPVLRRAAMKRLLPLLEAVHRVNGLSAEDSEKKSEAPASDSPSA